MSPGSTRPTDGRGTAQTRFEAAQRLFAKGDFEQAQEFVAGLSEELVASSQVVQHGGGKPPHPRVSIVIVSYRHSDVLDLSLEALARQDGIDGCEFLLVANGNDSLFETAKRYLRSFVGIVPPFPLGCSAGRNIGAKLAASDVVLFLDDDGIPAPGCIRALLSCMAETGAVAVRGKVTPRRRHAGPHYDLGMERVPSFIDCEGLSAWRLGPFLEHGGFHPLLAGHEGIELCSRLWREHGPLAFVYEPAATMEHEFVSAAGSAEKQQRYQLNRRFLEFLGGNALAVHALMQAIPRNGRQLYLSDAGLRAPRPQNGAPITIITTARDAAAFLAEYSNSWKRQTQTNFELVFVDDGSSDGTSRIAKELWRGDDRLVLIEQSPRGRGAALNAAFSAASHELCLIADVDDISIPSRIARTADVFRSHPGEDYLSFVAYNELDLFRIGPPASPFVSDMAVRSLFHMPASFPTFACRKSKFTERFDELLKGGVDCDWLRRNIEANNVRGRLVQYPVVYYRRHAGQITRSHNDQQWQMREQLIHTAFGKLLGPLSDRDKRLIRILVDEHKASTAQRQQLGGWVLNLVHQNDRLKVYDPEVLGPALLQAYDRVKQITNEDEQILSLRTQAEEHIAARDFRRARRVLRKALEIRDDVEVRTRLLAAHRWPIVRALVRSKPFQAPVST